MRPAVMRDLVAGKAGITLVASAQGSYNDLSKNVGPRVAIIGAGYVGMPLARVFADAGKVVLLVDVDREVVDGINRGASHIPDVSSDALKPLVDSGRVSATMDYDQHGQTTITGQATPGATITYTLTVSNAGPIVLAGSVMLPNRFGARVPGSDQDQAHHSRGSEESGSHAYLRLSILVGLNHQHSRQRAGRAACSSRANSDCW